MHRRIPALPAGRVRTAATRLSWLLILAIAAAGPASGTAPSLLPAEEESGGSLRSSGLFDRETIAAARGEIEKALAAAGDDFRRSALREQMEELDRAERLIEEYENPELRVDLDPPVSLRELDRMQKRRQALSERYLTLENAERSAERSLDRALRVLEDARRQAGSSPGDREAVDSAAGRVRLARFQLRNTRMERAIAAERLERLERALEDHARLRVTVEDLDERLAGVEADRSRLAGERKRLEGSVRKARGEWRAAGRDGSPGARVDALRERLDALERRDEVLAVQDQDLQLLEEAWTLRYRLAAGEFDSPADENRAERRLAANLSELVHQRDLARAEEDRLRAEIQGVELDRIEAEDGETARWHELRLDALRQRIEIENAHATVLDNLIADHRRWLDAFTAGGVRQNVQEGVSAIGETLSDAWNFEIATVDDRVITAGKLVLALILVLAGIFVSRILARILRRRVFERMSMDASLAASLQTLTLYFLVLVFFLTALRFVAIPLTALTFIGGALAIGIGFGSQNIVNNFISGLILMAERPIKVGDMIEVNGTYGRIERIGGRSTRVRSGNNTHIIVPNSTFLEREVLNWTLSDTRIRTHVDVGVAYGSPTREVTRLLDRSARDHGQILKTPEPEVLFTSFGDNALEFRVYFWIQVRQILDRLRIQSDVRYRIDQLFRDAGITIAFPQRDVHLDSLRPVDVRLVKDDEENPG